MVGTGIAPLPAHPIPTTPGTPPPYPRYTQHVNAGYVTARNSVVGLKSVDQLTWGPLFSRLREFTEVYNLLRIDNR